MSIPNMNACCMSGGSFDAKARGNIFPLGMLACLGGYKSAQKNVACFSFLDP